MLRARRLAKRFDVAGRTVEAVRDVDLDLAEGSFTVIVGRSGCGKSTLLRMLGGLVEPSAGSLAYTRGAPTVGCVFQEPRLMPWLTVARNVGFGLVGRLPRAEVARRTAETLALVGLEPFADAMPDQLSGGMASRVGLARALVLRPDLLLLDEPFAALDAFTRRAMQQELAELWTRRRSTVVFVTHDVEEAVLLGDTVLRMQEGRIAGQRAVPLPRPRRATDPRVVGLRAALIDDLFAESGRAGSPLFAASP